MPTSDLYYQRRKEGLCVSCAQPTYQKPNGGMTAYCETHAQAQRAYEQRSRKRDDASEALAGVSQARALCERWVAKTDHLPPLPTSCPRCTSMVVSTTIALYLEYSEAVRCPCCGYLTDRQMLANQRELEDVGYKAFRGGSANHQS